MLSAVVALLVFLNQCKFVCTQLVFVHFLLVVVNLVVSTSVTDVKAHL